MGIIIGGLASIADANDLTRGDWERVGRATAEAMHSLDLTSPDVPKSFHKRREWIIDRMFEVLQGRVLSRGRDRDSRDLFWVDAHPNVDRGTIYSCVFESWNVVIRFFGSDRKSGHQEDDHSPTIAEKIGRR